MAQRGACESRRQVAPPTPSASRRTSPPRQRNAPSRPACGVSDAFDKADLSEGARAALLGVVKELEARPTFFVRLGGFTDLTGTRDYNYGLARRRVEAVRRFLAEKGVELSRVQAIGMGPLDDRRIPEDKKRRVTVTLMADSPSRPVTRREVGE